MPRTRRPLPTVTLTRAPSSGATVERADAIRLCRAMAAGALTLSAALDGLAACATEPAARRLPAARADRRLSPSALVWDHEHGTTTAPAPDALDEDMAAALDLVNARGY